MRKVLCLMLCVFSLCSALTGVACASTNIANNVETEITVEEYKNAIKNLFDQYGVEIEFADVEEDFVFTEELLQEELEKLEPYLKTRQPEAIYESVTHSEPITKNITQQNTEIAVPYGFMPGTLSMTNYHTRYYSSGPLWYHDCQIAIYSTIYVDYQYNSITGSSAPILEMIYATNMEDWIRLDSYTKTHNQSNGTVTYYIDFTVKKTMNVSGIETWEKVSDSITSTFYPFS